jgi:hypothetical protein
MLTVKANKKVFTYAEVTNLTGICAKNLRPFSSLQPSHNNSVGKPVAPLLTAGAGEFAPSRVIEIANLI